MKSVEEDDLFDNDEELHRSMDNGDTVSLSPDGSNRPKCPECGKVFINKSVLNRHMRVHTGEKPYKCPLCDKAFSQLGNMTKHVKSHENAHLRWDRKTCSKPFKCSYPGCNKSFTAKTSLQSHLLSHQNELQLDDDGLESVQLEGSKASSSKLNKNAHYDMISSHLRHHHYPNSVIFQGDAAMAVEDEAAESNATLPHPPLVAVPEIAPSHSQCLHSGCNQVFNNQHELREHLHSFSPGLVAEHQFLINTVLQFADIINTWESKSNLEQQSLRAYAQSVQQAVEKMNKDIKAQPATLTNQQAEVIMDTTSANQTDRSDSTRSVTAPQHHWAGHGLEAPQNKPNGHHYYDPLHTDMGQYFQAGNDRGRRFVDTTHTQAPTTGVYSDLLNAHNSINDAWGQHHLPAATQLPSSEGSANHHRATMSWEEAIERSQEMLSKGLAHPSIFINPCHSWEPFNFLDILSDEVHPDEPDMKRHKSSHATDLN